MFGNTQSLSLLYWVAALAPSVLGSQFQCGNADHVSKRNLNKPVIKPQFYDGLDPGFLQYLKPTNYTIAPYGDDVLPQFCYNAVSKQIVNNIALSPNDTEAFNITYADVSFSATPLTAPTLLTDAQCPTPWVFCRHKDSNSTQDSIATLFGRLPVRQRSFIRHIVAVSGAPGAFNGGENIQISGNAINTLTVYSHEIGHSLDTHAFNNGNLSQGGFSSSQKWLDAYKADPAVASDYSQASQAENFAQMINVALFDQNIPGGIASICQNCQSQIGHQLKVINDNIGNVLKPGGTCANRLENTPSVKKVDGTPGWPVTVGNSTSNSTTSVPPTNTTPTPPPPPPPPAGTSSAPPAASTSHAGAATGAVTQGWITLGGLVGVMGLFSLL
jgi:hypothetical protein